MSASPPQTSDHNHDERHDVKHDNKPTDTWPSKRPHMRWIDTAAAGNNCPQRNSPRTANPVLPRKSRPQIDQTFEQLQTVRRDTHRHGVDMRTVRHRGTRRRHACTHPRFTCLPSPPTVRWRASRRHENRRKVETLPRHSEFGSEVNGFFSLHVPHVLIPSSSS